VEGSWGTEVDTCFACPVISPLNDTCTSGIYNRILPRVTKQGRAQRSSERGGEEKGGASTSRGRGSE